MALAEDNINGEAIIREFLEGIRAELIAYMDTPDSEGRTRNASGKSRASLQVVNLTNNAGQLVGAEWIQFVFKGRKPGKMPPLNVIIDWCNSKGIARSLAWVIAKRISELGTKLYQQRRNVFDEIITEEKVDAFIESFAVLYTAKLKTDIASLFYTDQ